MAGVRLERLKINRYRNVAPGTEFVFNPGFNVLLGKNGTGKTTLLRLIAMVASGEFGSVKGDELDIEYEIGLGPVTATIKLTNSPSKKPSSPTAHSTSDNDLPTLTHGSPWTYQASLQSHDARGERTSLLTVNSSAMGATALLAGGQESPIPVTSPFESNPLTSVISSIAESAMAEADDLERAGPLEYVTSVNRAVALAAREYRTAHNRSRFDEALGAFHAITGEHGRNVKRREDSVWSSLLVFVEGNQLRNEFGWFMPLELLAYIRGHEAPQNVQDGLRIGQSSLPFLDKAARAMAFRSAEMLLRLRKKDVQDGRDRLTYGDSEFSFTLMDGSIISEKDLSYGQKRLLSFLYYVACNPDIVIADELVNGLHYEWIETCLSEIQDRQSFLTSQNPVLLDMLPFSSSEEVQRTFVLCSLEIRDGHGEMVWKHMSPENAAAFFRAYETQALQVSEILRNKDLW